MPNPQPFLYTTSVPAHQSRAEITRLLARFHATSITQEFVQGEIVGVSFELAMAVSDKGQVAGVYRYTLPVRTERLYDRLVADVRRPRARTLDKLKIQAEKIAWRQLLVWLKAQLALVDLAMAEADEVFLPYMMQRDTGESFYQLFKAGEQKALGAVKND